VNRIATEMSMQQELKVTRRPLLKRKIFVRRRRLQAKTSIIKSSLALGLWTGAFAINLRFP